MRKNTNNKIKEYEGMIRMEGQSETRNSKKTKRKDMDEEDNEKKEKAMESQRLNF